MLRLCESTESGECPQDLGIIVRGFVRTPPVGDTARKGGESHCGHETLEPSVEHGD